MNSAFRNESLKKILVTGGTGFLGAYIIEELVTKGYQVRATRRGGKLPFFISPAILDKVEWVEGDILNLPLLESAMEGMDAVIHAAAMVSFSRSDRQTMFKTNIEGTANVVNTALTLKIKRLIHVSSVAALGRTEDGRKVTEEKKWEDSRFNTHYGISKHNAEMEVWRGIAEGLDAVIINPGTIIGFGDWSHSSCAIFKNAYNAFPWYTNGINGFVAVEDVARAAVLLMESGISSERFIVVGESMSFRQLFTLIANGFNKRPPYKEATPFLAGLAWRWEKIKSALTGTPALLTRETARLSRTTTYFDNSKLLAALPNFSFTSLESAIGQACSRYLNQVAESGK